LGSEPTPALFIEHLVSIFDEVRRVMRPDGVLWVNLGDSYSGSGKGPTGKSGIGDQGQRQGFTGVSAKSTLNIGPDNMSRKPIMGGGASVAGIPAKSLILIPERFAIAMQDAGWIVRSRIAWCKKAPMPESTKDRPTSAWEHIYMFTRQARYFWDQDAVRQPLAEGSAARYAHDFKDKRSGTTKGMRVAGEAQPRGDAVPTRALEAPAGANLRNYWLLGPEPSREQHYAAYPSEIPRRCILAATSEKGQCVACGVPWVRVVERTQYAPQVVPAGSRNVDESRGDKVRKLSGADYNASVKTLSERWQAGCQCDAGDPVPQLVLDPFAGSFTTSLVAERLGRNSVAIELNPDYVEIGKRRLARDGEMFLDIQTNQPDETSEGEQLALLQEYA
jgi:DNA modification methylase